MIQIRLLSDKVHLWPIKPPERLPSGLYVDASRQDDKMQYKILGVGPGRRRKDGTIRPLEVKPGQMALVPFLQDCVTLSDGSIVANVNQIAAVWE